jgi:chromosome segregation ATPase
MSKPVEHRLKEAEAAKVALEADVAKLAAENDTYTKRMKDMEDAIASAMEKMKAMEEKMDTFTKMKEQLDNKIESTAKSLADINIVEKNEEEEGEDEEEDDGEMEGEPMAENQIGGINPKVVTGQPNPTKQKKGKKAKKATTTSEDESIGKPVNDKFEKEKEMELKGKTKAEELPATEKVAEEVAPAPVAEQAPAVEKVAEEVAPIPVAEEVKPEAVAKEVAPAPVAKEVAPAIDINALVEAKVAEVAQKFASTLSKFSEMDSELVKTKEAKKVALDSVADLQAKYEALLSKVSGIQSEAKTVEEKVAKTVASLGVEPVSNSPAEISAEVIEKTAEELLKEWSAMTDAKAKRAFYLKHQATLVEATFPSKKK